MRLILVLCIALIAVLAVNVRAQQVDRLDAEERIQSLLEATAEADQDVAEAVDVLSNKDMEVRPLEDAKEIADVEAETHALIQSQEAMDPQQALQLTPYDELVLMETHAQAEALVNAHDKALDQIHAQTEAEAENEADADAEDDQSSNQSNNQKVKYEVVEDGILSAYPVENEETEFIELGEDKITTGQRKVININIKAPGRKLGVKARHLGQALQQMTSMHADVVNQISDVIGKFKFLKRHRPCNAMEAHADDNNDVRAWRREITHVTTLVTEPAPKPAQKTEQKKDDKKPAQKK